MNVRALKFLKAIKYWGTPEGNERNSPDVKLWINTGGSWWRKYCWRRDSLRNSPNKLRLDDPLKNSEAAGKPRLPTEASKRDLNLNGCVIWSTIRDTLPLGLETNNSCFALLQQKNDFRRCLDTLETLPDRWQGKVIRKVVTSSRKQSAADKKWSFWVRRLFTSGRPRAPLKPCCPRDCGCFPPF